MVKDKLDYLYKTDKTNEILIEIRKPIISKLSLLQVFNDISVLINHKATQRCLDDIFYSIENPSTNQIKKILKVFMLNYIIHIFKRAQRIKPYRSKIIIDFSLILPHTKKNIKKFKQSGFSNRVWVCCILKN